MIEMGKFDILILIGRLSKIRDWIRQHHFPPKLVFILLGIISTPWFLLRVIPKPSRAGSPCIQGALDSVCFDYLHYTANSSNWPTGITYNPDTLVLSKKN
jgi:hypothetical protein